MSKMYNVSDFFINLLNFVQMYMLLLKHSALFCCSVKYLVSDLVKIIHTRLE